MSGLRPQVLEFPAMLHGLTGAVLDEVKAMGQEWAREYLVTGTFTLPPMREVLPGELLIVDSGADSNLVPNACWRVHLFSDVFMRLNEGIPKAERQYVEDTFESFCLDTPWGALVHAVSPCPPWSAGRMSLRLAALMRFWDVLQGPRYALWYERDDTLEELSKNLYGMTLAAWCPEEASSVRERLALTVERMARANREACTQALLRAIPVLVERDTGLEHREALRDPGFLRERLAALPPRDFEMLSSTYQDAVSGALIAWDRELGRH